MVIFIALKMIRTFQWTSFYLGVAPACVLNFKIILSVLKVGEKGPKPFIGSASFALMTTVLFMYLAIIGILTLQCLMDYDFGASQVLTIWKNTVLTVSLKVVFYILMTCLGCSVCCVSLRIFSYSYFCIDFG